MEQENFEVIKQQQQLPTKQKANLSKEQLVLNQIVQNSQKIIKQSYNFMDKMQNQVLFPKASEINKEITQEDFVKYSESIFQVIKNGEFTNINEILFALKKSKGNQEKACELLKNKQQQVKEAQKQKLKTFLQDQMKMYEQLIIQLDSGAQQSLEQQIMYSTPFYSEQQELLKQSSQQQQTQQLIQQPQQQVKEEKSQQLSDEQAKIQQFLQNNDQRNQELDEQKKIINMQQKQKKKDAKKQGKNKKQEEIENFFQQSWKFDQYQNVYIVGMGLFKAHPGIAEIVEKKNRAVAQKAISTILQESIKILNFKNTVLYFGNAKHPVDTEFTNVNGEKLSYKCKSLQGQKEIKESLATDIDQHQLANQNIQNYVVVGQDVDSMQGLYNRYDGLEFVQSKLFMKVMEDAIGSIRVQQIVNENL